MNPHTIDIDADIKNVIAQQLSLPVDGLTVEQSILGDLGASSLDAIALLVEIEYRYGIDIPDEEAEQLHTVGQLIAYVRDSTATADGERTLPAPDSSAAMTARIQRRPSRL